MDRDASTNRKVAFVKPKELGNLYYNNLNKWIEMQFNEKSADICLLKTITLGHTFTNNISKELNALTSEFLIQHRVSMTVFY